MPESPSDLYPRTERCFVSGRRPGRCPRPTYVSVLIRAHLRQLAPLPDRELSALQSAVNELAVLGRNLNTIARSFQQDRREVAPGRGEVYAMLKICEGLRDRFRELIKANLVSWELGHAENAR